MRDASAMTRSLKIAIDLPEALLRSLGHAARAAGVSPTDYLRNTLAAAVERIDEPTQDQVVRRSVEAAEDWLDLQQRLRGAGYVLRRAEDGSLMLHDWPLNHPLLPLAELGYSLAALTLGFRAPFPTDVSPGRAEQRPARRAA
jgi:hypothetical protein